MKTNSLHCRDAEDAEFPQRETTEAIIGAAIEVHRLLGPGLLESVYLRALQHELALRNLAVLAQVVVPVVYKGVALEADLRLDLLVAKVVIVEVKSVVAIEEVHRAQLLTYLRLTGLQAGLIINFNATTLRQGIRRVANSLRPSASSAPLR
ncbi:MAG TPA: GxxExxY protein [Rubrivivax sp.]|nr:GxxExxY protein [Rubrivivax sp.]